MAKDPATEASQTQTRPAHSKAVALPCSIQETLDNEEKSWELFSDGNAPQSTDTNIRYAAYAARVRTILVSAQRYVAYTSDIGESFRPVAHPWLVRGAYGISWAYLAGDVGYEGYKAYLRNQRLLHPHDRLAAHSDRRAAPAPVSASTSAASLPSASKTATATAPSRSPLEAKNDAAALVPHAADTPDQGHSLAPIDDYRAVMAQRAIFQGLASMGLPAFTIHSIVRYSGRALKNAKNMRIRTYGPIGLGLAAVPFLPMVFDKPVEEAVEWVFHTGFRAVGGPSAVGHAPSTGREAQLQKDTQAATGKIKEL